MNFDFLLRHKSNGVDVIPLKLPHMWMMYPAKIRNAPSDIVRIRGQKSGDYGIRCHEYSPSPPPSAITSHLGAVGCFVIS